jgi:hypothetical protein
MLFSAKVFGTRKIFEWVESLSAALWLELCRKRAVTVENSKSDASKISQKNDNSFESTSPIITNKRGAKRKLPKKTPIISGVSACVATLNSTRKAS